MTAAGPLRWGILGTGRITARIARAPVDPRRHVIAAVGSRDPGRAREHAQRHGIERSHGSYDALLADPGIDVVYIALPNHLHAEWAIRAVEAGKHVLVEKPIALSVTEVDAIATAAARHDRVVVEGFMYLHHPQTRSMLDAIATGRLGTIRLIRGSFSFTLTYVGDPRLVAAMGGGSLWDLGGYPVSFARLALGADPDEVLGMQVLADGVDLGFSGQLRFPGDRLALIDTSFQAPDRELLEVVGSEGVLTVAPAFLAPSDRPTTYTIVGRDGRRSSVAIAAADPYRAEMDDLAAAIEDARPVVWTLADSRATVAALEALHRAAATIGGIRPLGRPGLVGA